MLARLTEKVVDLFLDVFMEEGAVSEAFNARITAMNTANEDTLLKPILQVLDDPPDVATPRNFPAIHVWGTGMSNAVDQPLSQFGANHTIRIAVAIQGQQKLQRQLYRYADLILQVVGEVTADDEETWALGDDIDVEYGEAPYEATGGKVVQAIVTVQMEHAESLVLEEVTP